MNKLGLFFALLLLSITSLAQVASKTTNSNQGGSSAAPSAADTTDTIKYGGKVPVPERRSGRSSFPKPPADRH